MKARQRQRASERVRACKHNEKIHKIHAAHKKIKNKNNNKNKTMHVKEIE